MVRLWKEELRWCSKTEGFPCYIQIQHEKKSQSFLSVHNDTQNMSDDKTIPVVKDKEEAIDKDDIMNVRIIVKQKYPNQTKL